MKDYEIKQRIADVGDETYGFNLFSESETPTDKVANSLLLSYIDQVLSGNAN